MSTDTKPNQVQPIEGYSMALVNEAEINQQVATAKKYPRSMGRVIQDITDYATNDEETAFECIYVLKRDGKEIVGPSVRFAEIVATSWGNARFASRIIGEGDQFVIAQAVFHDLERNTFISVEVPRRIVKANGQKFGIDMIGVTSNAAMSIAMRNAILKGIPKAAWGGAYAKCLSMIAGTFESIERRRTAALGAFQKMGVDQTLVLGLLEKEHVRDIEPEDMVILRGTLQAIKDGDTTLHAVFGQNAARKAGAAKANIGQQLDEGKVNDDANQKEISSAPKAEKKVDTKPAKGKDDPKPKSGNKTDKADEAEQESSGDESASADAEKDKPSETEKVEDVVEDDSQLPIAPEFDEALDAPGLDDADCEKMRNLCIALTKAEGSKAVAQVSEEFAPIIDVGSQEFETAALKAIGIAQKLVRGRSASNKL